MIEIKITGENAMDAANHLLGFANFVAIGVNVVQAQQNQTAPVVEAPVTEEAPKAAEKKTEAKKAAAPEPEPEQADIEDVLDDDVVEDVARPIPQNIEQLRELVMKVHTKVGAVKGSAIVQAYAPKISGVPTDKYAELAGKLYDALEK